MSSNNKKHSVFWFRRDLRLEDNKGLYRALQSGHPVIPLFIFDTDILHELEDRDDARVSFIHQQIERLDEKLKEKNSGFYVYFGRPIDVWKQLLSEYSIQSVFTNRDYEPYAKKRDGEVASLLEERGVEWHTFKDHVLTEAGEVLKKDGGPYVVFTPFKRKWLEVVKGNGDLSDSDFFKHFPSESNLQGNLARRPNREIPRLNDMGFQPSSLKIPSQTVKRQTIKEYDEKRDFPAANGTSKLGIHYRFGTISIRQKAKLAHSLNATYLNELIWRDFYSHILAHFPRVENEPFDKRYANIEWINDEEDFERWCEGNTGYPLVDAGMRQLNETGYMHNRLRMLTASFLAKHLLIDWRWGEAYFARKLLDFDLASNNGGWQWAAGCGTDAAPYFRIFNPDLQLKKFDKNLEFTKKYIPELNEDSYPDPIVDHKAARKRCLEAYKKALK